MMEALHARRSALAGLWFATLVSSAVAQGPRVTFDMPYAVSCRDVTSPEYASANPGHKLIEIKLGISSLLAAGKERDLAQFFIRMESPQRTMQVIDFLPKTSRESLQGPTSIQKTSETALSLGITVSGKYEGFTGSVTTPGISQKNTSCVKYDLLPPLETVTASGTMLRGSGVYFRLKSSERNLLEGSRDFALVLRVPRAWRADYLHVRCEAEGIARGMVSSLDQSHACGQRDFLVSLYLEGDEQARRTAEAFSRAEAQLRTVAHVKASAVEKRAYPTLATQLGISVGAATPVIPPDWQARLLFGHPSKAEIPKKLPREVVQAAQEYLAARLALTRLNGWRVTASVSDQAAK